MKNNCRRFIRLAWLALGLCALQTAHAEKTDRDKPIEISADRGNLDQLKGVTVWQGNVIIIQGTLKLNADRATVTQDKQGNQTMQATGRQVVFRQKMDGKNEWIEGQANQLDYNTVTHAAVLTGNARVKRGNDLVIGNVITYNTETEMYDVSSGASSNGGRVTAIIQPKPRDNTPAAKKTDGSAQ
ncbi:MULTISPECIES: lipopolysaccharide transport periplasmic protein LptA [Aquitalea]|jgi:lipopolysaccharide export system protein LptA|uniref:lipopolysaccharide transport periplasmic protein LptA n=1 Tax=Aquitalea TaxID=407217 RepID=UPI0013571446|nr:MULTISPECIES: lipopolysaccharide transport periplasmic protein LptA [Aquitalea]